MIDRIRDRRTFESLRAHGLRIRRGPLSMTHLHDDDDDRCRVAFAIPRRTGNAVVRNRIRRRVLAILRDLDRNDPARLPAGALLIGAGPGAVGRSHTELRADVLALLDELLGRRRRSA